MPNKTISVPDDVLPIIDRLDVPFSRWVTEQLRRHEAEQEPTFAEQILADAALVDETHALDPASIGQRMQRSAPW